MSLTTILLIGLGVCLLLWLMIHFKLFNFFAEILEAICDGLT